MAVPAAAQAAATVQGMVDNVINNVIWPVGLGAVVIFWIITGVLFLSAMGAPEKLGIAKKALFASVAGTIIVVLAATAITLIKGALGI